MANRVILGKRGTDYGLFVSRSGQDVTTSNDALGFDSRASDSLIVHSIHEGALVPQVTNSSGTQLTRTNTFVSPNQTINQHTATITHNLGYVPCFVIRWSTFDDMNGSGQATQTYPPFDYYGESPESVEEDVFEEGDEVTFPGGYAQAGLALTSVTTNAITIKNQVGKQHDNSNGVVTENTDTTVRGEAFYFWSCIIFTAENFLNGESL